MFDLYELFRCIFANVVMPYNHSPTCRFICVCVWGGGLVFGRQSCLKISGHLLLNVAGIKMYTNDLRSVIEFSAALADVNPIEERIMRSKGQKEDPTNHSGTGRCIS